MVKRRISIALLSLSLSMVVFATKKDLEKDIIMVSYEQGWLDIYGTLALKNNSNEEIRNVVFMITYLDMSGKEMDYEEFTKDVTIAPGMTKKLDIPAYEHSRNYHYYKSEGSISGSSPSFKIEFKIKDYNIGNETADTVPTNPVYKHDYQQSGNNIGASEIVNILMFLLCISVTIGLYVFVFFMARDRNRNVVVWVLLSFVTTPLLMVFILLIVGKDNRNIDHHERI